jgi:hypothetical protein
LFQRHNDISSFRHTLDETSKTKWQGGRIAVMRQPPSETGYYTELLLSPAGLCRFMLHGEATTLCRSIIKLY